MNFCKAFNRFEERSYSMANKRIKMNLRDALYSRRSVRKYATRDVPREMIEYLLEAAECAPSAGNLRARYYLIVTRQEMRKLLSMAAYNQTQIENASVLIIICADVERSSKKYGDRGSLYAIQDADAAAMCILLAAHDQGLGACWNGAFDDAIVRELLHLKENLLPIAIVSIGWPLEEPHASARRSLLEVAKWIE